MGVKFRLFQNNSCVFDDMPKTFGAPIDDLTVASCAPFIIRKSPKTALANRAGGPFWP